MVCLGLSIVGFTLEEMALAYLLREIRLCGGLIDGFSMEEVDYIAFFCLYHLMFIIHITLCAFCGISFMIILTQVI